MGDAPVVYGKYQLLDLLARGGMAEVFRAKSHGVEGFEKILVIKRILSELSQNSQFVEMFINEAKIAVTLSHANIVQVFDLGRADETYFIAMEYVAGHDLATVLRRSQEVGKDLPPELAVFVASEVAKALDYAHRRRDAQLRPMNIVHRDVSPQNVLISYEGEVKLTDFGIARARTTVEDDEGDGVLKGKYAYMAPEQAKGQQVDARVDVFALGTVLYETLCGENPFQAGSAYDTLQRVKEGHATPLVERDSAFTQELSDIVATSMAPDLAARFPDAGRFYESLIQYLYASGRRVSAHDLARHLDDVRAATEGDRAKEDAVLQAAFSGDSRPQDYEPEATPVEVPGGRRAPTTGSGRRARRGSQVTMPRGELRDVSAVVLRAGRSSTLPDTTLHALISRFGGMVSSQETDGSSQWTSLLFGVTQPDGRDTESAGRCAIRVARATEALMDEGTEMNFALSVSVGRVLVDMQEEVVAGKDSEKLMHRARKLAESAAAGHILASSEAAKFLRGSFELEDPPEALDGARRLLGERSTAEAFGKFVGRKAELRKVGEVLALANKGRRQVIGIVGEAGTGKTRLLHESTRRLRLGGHDVGIHLATVPRHRRDVPLAAFQEMLAVILAIDELDPEPIIRDKVSRLRELGLSAPEIQAVETLFGLAANGGERLDPGGRPLRAALGRIATRLAADRLTVLAFDGVDSMDEESQIVLDGVLRHTRSARIVVVLAYRPGFLHAWGDMAGYHEIDMQPLEIEDVGRLTAARLGVDAIPGELLRDVTAKSGGNPLYVEEFASALQDAGAITVTGTEVTYRPDVAEVEVPKTLRGIVSARLARLGQLERQVLQIAAVVGTDFGPRVMAQVANLDVSRVAKALRVLERRGIIVRRGASEFDFTHDLVGEVLRDGLALESRRELHGAVGAAYEELFPQRVDELAEQLAEHWRKAGDRAKAIDYRLRAVDRLESEQSLVGAVSNLARAIDMLVQTPSPDRDRVLGLYRRIGELSFRSRDLDTGAERMEAAAELAEGLGRDEYVARFSMMRGRLLAHANRFGEGRRWLDRARDVARQIGNRDLLRDITAATAEANTRNGQYSNAAGLLQEALLLSRDGGDVQAQLRCLMPLAMAHGAAGDSKAALEALSEARQLAGMQPDRFTDCELLKTEALVHYYARNHQGTVEASSRALDLAKEYGFYHEAAVNAHNLGEGYLRLGDYKRAFASLRYSYELATDRSLVRLEQINLRVLGFIDAVRFGSADGRRRIAEAADYARDNELVWDLIQSCYLLAIADYSMGDLPEARRGLQETIRLSSEHGDSRYREDAEQALCALEAGEPVPLPS